MSTVIVLHHPDHAPQADRPFWLVPPVRLTLAGARLTTQVGDLQPSTQRLRTVEAAKEHLERVLRLHREEGYRIASRDEIEGDEPGPASEPVGDILRLDEHGRAHLAFHEDATVEDLISPEEIAAVMPRLLAWAPSSIHVVRGEESRGGHLAAALAGQVLPSARSAVYHALSTYRHLRKPLDDLADLLAAFPGLERLDAAGELTLREARHGALQELYLSCDPLFPETLAAIGGGSLPALTTLALELGDDHGLDRAAGAALRSLAAPRLRAVLVAEVEDVTSLLAELTERPLPAPWTMLCVRGGVGDEDDLLTLLRERASLLGAVPMLGLPLADELSEGGIAEAKTTLPEVVDVCDLPDLWASSGAW